MPDALWLVTKYSHVTTYGHGRHLLGRKSTRTNQRLSGNLPAPSLVVAGSHRHVHLIDAGIQVLDETVHASAGLCADKDCETIPLLKWAF